MSLREAARSVFDAALRAADVHPLVRRALADVHLAARGRVLVVGAGKASGAMAAAAEGALGDRIADGLVVVKDGYLADTTRVRLVEAGHPVPDARGEAAPLVGSGRSPSPPGPTICCLSWSRAEARR